MERAKLPPAIRKPIYLVIDEADTFIQGASVEIILKETRKYGLHLILATQNLVSGKGQMSLRKNLLNNTATKIIGNNGISTLKPLAQETMIPWQELIQTKAHEFRVKSGDQFPRKVKPKDMLGMWSGLLLSKGQVRSVNHRLLTASPYYKLLVPSHPHPHEWIDEMPVDLQQLAQAQASPKAKFNLN